MYREVIKIMKSNNIFTFYLLVITTVFSSQYALSNTSFSQTNIGQNILENNTTLVNNTDQNSILNKSFNPISK